MCVCLSLTSAISPSRPGDSLKLRDFGLLISINKAFIGVISRQKSHHRLLNHPKWKAIQVCECPAEVDTILDIGYFI